MHREYSRALDQSGITVNILAAGHFKTAGNSAQPLSDEMKSYIQSGIDDVYDMPSIVCRAHTMWAWAQKITTIGSLLMAG